MSSTETNYQIAARIERLPLSTWHLKILVPIGTGWFFDAFDALAIAYVLPVLAGLWKLTQPDIGGLIAVGYIGQVIGSIFFGWLAERLRLRLGPAIARGHALGAGDRAQRRDSDHGVL